VATSINQICEWMSLPRETEGLEFKEAKAQFDSDKLYSYCVGIANEGGGKLLLGITDEPPRQIVGTPAFQNLAKTQRQILDVVKFRVTIEEVIHPNGRILVVHIPARPSGTAYSLRGTYLMRTGEQLVSMTEDRLRAIFAESKEAWLEEQTKTGLDAQEVVALLDTQAVFDLLHIPYPSNRAAVIERLEQLEFIDSVGATYSIRRLGAIIAAKELRQFPELARKAARVIIYKGQSKLETELDKPGNKGYAVGFKALVRYVCDHLPQNEVIQDALRTTAKLVPEDVIRELLANALIHQDFEISGTSMVVEIYQDRILVSNPGCPLVPVDRFIDGCRSRNERFAMIMRRLGVCEEKGSGIDRVIETVEVHQLPAP